MNPSPPRRVVLLGVTVLGLLVAGVLIAGHPRPKPVLHRKPAHLAHVATTSAGPSPASTTTSATAAAASSTTTTIPVPPLAVPTTQSGVHWVEQKVSLTYQGLSRGYILFRPAARQATPIPVVVELAGCCVSAEIEAARDNLKGVAGPVILVYPEYYEKFWNAGACCGPPTNQGVDDVGFVNTVIDRVRSSQPDAAPGPVYLAGYSNGGKLAMEMACREPSAFAAVAVYGATRTTSCSGPPPASVLIMAGTADPEDSVNGPPVVQNGFTEPTVNQLVDSYLAADGCSASRQTLTLGATSIARWGPCSNSRLVQEVLYQGANHTWQAGSGQTPSAEQVMWDFFAQFGA
ncbi:MAG TPA: PHB depolymerase family esterase [Acidimicrobiales bacterium]|nr:PHB depolymerase family esterase [Acidimicrobiales bacterium]